MKLLFGLAKQKSIKKLEIFLTYLFFIVLNIF